MARCLLGHTTAFENENSTAISRHTHPRAQQYKKKNDRRISPKCCLTLKGHWLRRQVPQPMEEDSHSFSSYSYNKRAGKQKKKKKTAKMFGADFTWYHPLQQPQKEKDIHKDCIYIYIYKRKHKNRTVLLHHLFARYHTTSSGAAASLPAFFSTFQLHLSFLQPYSQRKGERKEQRVKKEQKACDARIL